MPSLRNTARVHRKLVTQRALPGCEPAQIPRAQQRFSSLVTQASACAFPPYGRPSFFVVCQAAKQPAFAPGKSSRPAERFSLYLSCVTVCQLEAIN
jgi:hypothetical protein